MSLFPCGHSSLVAYFNVLGEMVPSPVFTVSSLCRSQDKRAEADEGAGEERAHHLNRVFISAPGEERRTKDG